ncbi:MAG: VanW family protein [bacterium]|nr:VanW family protein [bacterium]
MLLVKKLGIIVIVLFLILSFLVAEIFKLSKERKVAKKIYVDNELAGSFSQSLLAAKEKNFTVFWNDKQKNIPLGSIIVSYHRQYTGRDELKIDFKKLNSVLEELSPTIKKEPVNAKVEYSATENRIKEFALSQSGLMLNVNKSASKIVQEIAQGRLTGALVIDEIPPEVTLNSLAELGITSLLAKGESDFIGSSPGRIHNIKIGSAKFQGLIVKSGEEFSFNQNLGEVDGQEGYRAELVIKSGKLVSEYGGGICQVSTTLFRAAVISGLPILERRPHSFPVRYYNPQGFDATIYPGVTDLRFTNDTNGHLLIQNRIEGTKLVFEIFGSPDGRNVSVNSPQILEQNTNGSMKTVLTRKITTADGKVKEDSFWSNYKSPASFPLERNPLE